MTEQIRRLRMFAGPNGSGKTSLLRKLAREYSAEGLFHLHHYINADDIAANLMPAAASSWSSSIMTLQPMSS
jgi:predicted ABC-type ATPase